MSTQFRYSFSATIRGESIEATGVCGTSSFPTTAGPWNDVAKWRDLGFFLLECARGKEFARGCRPMQRFSVTLTWGPGPMDWVTFVCKGGVQWICLPHRTGGRCES